MKSAIFVALAIPAFAASAQLYTFSDGPQGWTTYDVRMSGHVVNPGHGAALSWDSAFGNPAGSLRVTDLAGETTIGPPAAILGNRSDLIGQSIEWDMFVRFTDAGGYSPIVLAGANITLYYRPSEPTLNTWLHVTTPLTSGNWRVNSEANGSPVATDAQIREVLSDLRGLFIRTEYKTGTDDTSVDNVSIGNPATPCPADFNGDGFADGFDYDDFVACFEGDPCPPGKSADFNNDGFPDGFDYDDFVAAFEAGCN